MRHIFVLILVLLVPSASATTDERLPLIPCGEELRMVNLGRKALNVDESLANALEQKQVKLSVFVTGPKKVTSAVIFFPEPSATIRETLQMIGKRYPITHSFVNYGEPPDPPKSGQHSFAHKFVTTRIGWALNKAQVKVEAGEKNFLAELLFDQQGKKVDFPRENGAFTSIRFAKHSAGFETTVSWQEFVGDEIDSEMFVNGYAVCFRDLKGNVYVDFMGERNKAALLTPLSKLEHLNLADGYEISIMSWDRYPYLFWPDKPEEEPQASVIVPIMPSGIAGGA